MTDTPARNSIARWIVPSLGSILTLTVLVNSLLFRADRLSREYLTVLKGLPGWEGSLHKNGVPWTLIRKEESISQLLDLSRKWNRVYEIDLMLAFRLGNP